MEGGWIKIHRKICLNGTWKKPMDFRLFFYLLVNAVFDEVNYDDVVIKRGQYLRSYRQLQEDLSFIENNRVVTPSLSSLKRSVEHLVNLKMIATLETRLGTLFTIVNYRKYQSESEHLTDSKNEHGTGHGTGLGTPQEHLENNNKNDKKDKNEKDTYIPEFPEFLEYAKTLSIYNQSFDFQLQAKYNQWKENEWRDGFNKPIKNWKTKIQNTMPHFKLNGNGHNNNEAQKSYGEDPYAALKEKGSK